MSPPNLSQNQLFSYNCHCDIWSNRDWAANWKNTRDVPVLLHNQFLGKTKRGPVLVGLVVVRVHFVLSIVMNMTRTMMMVQWMLMKTTMVLTMWNKAMMRKTIGWKTSTSIWYSAAQEGWCDFLLHTSCECLIFVDAFSSQRWIFSFWQNHWLNTQWLIHCTCWFCRKKVLRMPKIAQKICARKANQRQGSSRIGS